MTKGADKQSCRANDSVRMPVGQGVLRLDPHKICTIGSNKYNGLHHPD
jgi:hypothetical protein